MATTDYKFEGWAGDSPESIKGNLKWTEYEPKAFADDDVDIKILYCGICASDISVLSSGWGDMSSMYPQVVGHEIVGEIVRVGPKVQGLKVGDVAGVGAQCDSCLSCHYCDGHREQYCQETVWTYGDRYRRTSPSSKTYGGYANYWRGPSRFAVTIPSSVDPADAAPLMCGGVTVYSPLRQYGAGTTAKDVGVVGIGGLGHFAVMFAKEMGARVTAISHSEHKRGDAEKLGAVDFLATGKEDAYKGRERTLDLIICTSNAQDMPLNSYLSLLRPGGHFILVGLPEGGNIAPVNPFSLTARNVHIAGSSIGSPEDIREMLEIAGAKGIKPWIKKWSLDKVNEAVPDMVAGNSRYRYVLVNEANGGKL
ncbi:hypothetical protein IAT38_000979 [Cryptococcus sp. DSM 104549]